MKVLVYVEGPSDKLAMQVLLRPLLERKQQLGIAIDFFEAPRGDKKKSVLEKVPIKAASILRGDPSSFVIALPDLYPKNISFPHETPTQLEVGIGENFKKAMQTKGMPDDIRFERRFRVFCFKHDLEALLLASKEALKKHLGDNSLNASWRLPVEDQNHGNPPKRVIEDLFERHGRRYRDTVDAPLILSGSSYLDLADRCPQCFKPFVEFLEGLRPEDFGMAS